MRIDWQKFVQHDDDNVRGFFGDYRWMSNFHVCDIRYGEDWYASTEHAYMAAKCANASDRRLFRTQGMTCAAARKLGQSVELRKDWESVKFSVMLDVNYDKYLRHVELREKLLATGNRYIEETNTWGDVYWGYDINKKQGDNRLGEILMRLRTLFQPPVLPNIVAVMNARRSTQRFATGF